MTYSIKKNCKQLKTVISQNQKKEDIFFSFEFLSALEESDCLDADSGWTPNSMRKKIVMESSYSIMPGQTLILDMVKDIIQNL